MYILGSPIAILVLSKRLHIDDSMIGVLSTVFDMAGNVLRALAWAPYVMYIGKSCTLYLNKKTLPYFWLKINKKLISKIIPFLGKKLRTVIMIHKNQYKQLKNI